MPWTAPPTCAQVPWNRLPIQRQGGRCRPRCCVGADGSVWDLIFPFFKETVAALVSFPIFAYTYYRYGRYVGNNADKKGIDSLHADVASITGSKGSFFSSRCQLRKCCRRRARLLDQSVSRNGCLALGCTSYQCAHHLCGQFQKG
jgi:hypothetical protein